MDSTIWAAVISALSGVFGAYLGARMTTHTDQVKSERNELRSAQYLATLVAPDLDRFASQCLMISYDDGYEEGRPAGANGTCEATVHPLEFKPLDFNVDWKALPGDLMKEVLTFPEKWHAVADELSDDDGYDDPPEHSKFFADRQYLYTKLGIEAVALSSRLFEETKLAVGPQGPTSLPAKLQARKLALEVERAGAIARIEKCRRSAETVFSAPIPPMPTSAAEA